MCSARGLLSNSAQTALRTARATAHGATLPQEIDVPSTPTPKPATAMGRHSCSPATVKARITAINQPTAITMMTGHGSSRIAGRAGGSGSPALGRFGAHR